MKQIFSSYPDGIAGFALVLLRSSAVALLAAACQGPHTLAPWFRVSAVVVAAALASGFGTRPAVVLCAMMATLTLPTAYGISEPLFIAQGLSLSGLLLLGPGAFSVDARLFGRRKISLNQ